MRNMKKQMRRKAIILFIVIFIMSIQIIAGAAFIKTPEDFVVRYNIMRKDTLPKQKISDKSQVIIPEGFVVRGDTIQNEILFPVGNPDKTQINDDVILYELNLHTHAKVDFLYSQKLQRITGVYAVLSEQMNGDDWRSTLALILGAYGFYESIKDFERLPKSILDSFRESISKPIQPFYFQGHLIDFYYDDNYDTYINIIPPSHIIKPNF